MEKHFFKRILTVIVIFIVVFLLNYIFVESTLIEGARDRGILAFLFVFLVIIAVILGLIFDIISQYRKNQGDKANASLLVLIIFLFILFVVAVISFH
jgi:hypothetical protein